MKINRNPGGRGEGGGGRGVQNKKTFSGGSMDMFWNYTKNKKKERKRKN